MLLALTITLSWYAVIQEQTLTLDSSAGSGLQYHVSFSSTKWKPVNGKSLIVETVRNHIPKADMHFTFRQTPIGTAMRAKQTPEGDILPSRVTIGWTTYRVIRETEGGPIYRWPIPDLGRPETTSQHTSRRWLTTGDAPTGKAGQSLEAYLLRDDRELFRCRSVIEMDKAGAFVIHLTAVNSSAKDALLEWGPYKESVKAGKSREFTIESAAAPKEVDRNCSVSFQGDARYVFKSNSWAVP